MNSLSSAQFAQRCRESMDRARNLMEQLQLWAEELEQEAMNLQVEEIRQGAVTQLPT